MLLPTNGLEAKNLEREAHVPFTTARQEKLPVQHPAEENSDWPSKLLIGGKKAHGYFAHGTSVVSCRKVHRICKGMHRWLSMNALSLSLIHI